MHFKLLVLCALVSAVRNHDVFIGSEGGRIIFEDTRFASPAIWRQVENVTVIAPENEVISKVNITDMRAEKDGDVQIVNGGEGEKSVTIEIKSPTVLRGYEFHIQVFSQPESNYKKSENADKIEGIPEVILNNEYSTPIPQNSDSESSGTNEVNPTQIAQDSDVLRPARETVDGNNIPELTEESKTEISSTEIVYEESTTTKNYPTTIDSEQIDEGTTESVEGSGSEENATPIIPSDWLRPARGADAENYLSEISLENEAAMTTTENLNEVYTTIDDISTPYGDVDNQDSTTEVPEVIAMDADVIRPARETNNGNEATVTTTEAANEETTDDNLKVNGIDYTMNTPNTYVNSKNMQDYSASSILDYIKSKEQGNRQIRRIDEEASDTESSTEEEDNEKEDSSSTESQEGDETADLVPPEINAPYNDNFTPDPESTEESTETSTEINSGASTMDSSSENSTSFTEDTTESSLQEKSRNSRNTEDNLENGNSFDLASETDSSEQTIVATADRMSSGIVLIKGDRVIITADGKEVQFNLPIVLIIGNEKNFPIFKIIEDSSDIDKKELDQTASGSIDSPDTDYEASDAANEATDIVKTDEYSY